MLHQKFNIFISTYVPKGWTGPIKEFASVPHVIKQDFDLICQGKDVLGFDRKPLYKEYYFRAAIKAFFEIHPNIKNY